jgi:hypothetical protein
MDGLVLIKCKTGGEMIEVPEGQDPHAALDATGCSHCADGHGPDIHCGEAANACPQDHDGTCLGHGETAEERASRPDGCTVCRPILFMGNATFVNTEG